MSWEWLASLSRSRSLSARIEGRNVAIVVILGFCTFGLWLFVSSYEKHPWLSSIFCGLFVVIAILVVIASLMIKPHPSEVSEKWILETAGQKLFSAGGFQSSDELRELLRHAHNIHDLPPPVALVKGSASNPSDYRDLSAADSAKLAQQDREGVTHQLEGEAVNIAKLLISGRIGSAVTGLVTKKKDTEVETTDQETSSTQQSETESGK